MNRLTEANKFFFGTENTSEVKKLFESVSEEKSLYKSMCEALIENAKFSYIEDIGEIPNMFTGPCVMRKFNDKTYIIGFGAFAKSKGYKTGTKVDRMKIHVITDNEKIRFSYPNSVVNSMWLEPEKTSLLFNGCNIYSSDCANIFCDMAVYFSIMEKIIYNGLVYDIMRLFPILDEHHYGIRKQDEINDFRDDVDVVSYLKEYLNYTVLLSTKYLNQSTASKIIKGFPKSSYPEISIPYFIMELHGAATAGFPIEKYIKTKYPNNSSDILQVLKNKLGTDSKGDVDTYSDDFMINGDDIFKHAGDLEIVEYLDYLFMKNSKFKQKLLGVLIGMGVFYNIAGWRYFSDDEIFDSSDIIKIKDPYTELYKVREDSYREFAWDCREYFTHVLKASEFFDDEHSLIKNK